MNDSSRFELTGKILVAGTMILFFIIVSVIVLYYYYFKTLSFEPLTGRLDYNHGQPPHSLDPSVLNSVPVLVFSSKEFRDSIECSICLSQTVDGEKIRILPQCNHGFHVDCIDMWFHSNSTCPVCRNLVSNESESKTEPEFTSSSSSVSASPSSSNVRPEEMLVIDMKN